MFQHYIVTRFNLKSKNKDGIFKRGASEEWMDERFKIFLEFCYPSVMQQENKNFSWFVFFDVDTSDKYKKIIEKLSNESDIFVPVYADCNENLIPELRSEIKARLNSDYIITSRLDNDDSLHKAYVESVQQQFNQQKYLAVNFINGETLQASNEVLLGYRIHANNPFISLIESAEGELDTVYLRDHGGWGRIQLNKQIDNEHPLWLTVNHECNIRNRYIGFGNVPESTLDSFNIESATVKEIKANLKDNDLVTSLRNKLTAYLHYYLKVTRNKIRTRFNLIPQR